jgi:hypothetical protein
MEKSVEKVIYFVPLLKMTTIPAEHPYFRRLGAEFGGHGRKFSKVASSVYTVGGLVGFYIGVGTIRMMTAGDKILGICKRAVAATGVTSDIYADTTPIEVEILFQMDEVHCPVSAGTVALTELGDEADVVTGGLSITLTESNNDFRQVALNGDATDSVIATPQTTVY